MIASNCEASFQDRPPEPQANEHAATFRHIVKVAAALGFIGRPDEENLCLEGHVRIRDEYYCRVLSHVQGRKKLVLHTRLADPVRNPTRQFDVKFHEANAAVIGTKVIFDPEDNSVRVESCVDYPATKEEARHRLADLFRSADELLGSEHLWTALAIGDAVLLGTPAALWDVA